MTPAKLIKSGACCAACLVAGTDESRCSCVCGGKHHGALGDVDITLLLDARRHGYHRMTDGEILGGVA